MIKRGSQSKAQAGILVVIILILLAIGAFIILWNVYYYLIADKASGISVDAFLVDGEFEYYLPSDLAIINVHRKAGEGEIIGLKILFTEKGTGNTYSYNTTNYPKPLETKTYIIKPVNLNPQTLSSFTNIESISLFYLFPDKTPSRELDKKKITPENISSGMGENWYCDTDRDGFGLSTPVFSTRALAEQSCPTKSTPISGDCDDSLLSKNPSATETCDGIDNNCDGVTDENNGNCASGTYCNGVSGCLGNKNYAVTTSGFGTYSNGDTGCTYNAISDGQQISLPTGWNFKFYTDTIGSVFVCKNGYLTIGSADCSSTGTNGITDLTNKKTIAPFMKTISGNPSYCIDASNNYIVFKWFSTPITSKLFLYSNGEIRFSYTGQYSLFEGGISYSGGTHYNETHGYNINSNQNDYKLTF